MIEEVVHDLRAIYDAGNEAVLQRNCAIEDMSASEVCELAGISERRASLAFDEEPVTDETLWADLHALAKMARDAAPLFACVENAFAEFADQLTSKDPVELALVAREINRISNNADSDSMRERESWELHEASLAAAGVHDDLAIARLASLRRVDAVFQLRYNELYTVLGEMLGLRPRAPMTIEEFATAAVATLEGVQRTGHGTCADVDTWRPTGPDGEMQRWTTAGILFEALLMSSLEPDPFAEVSADLSVWRLPNGSQINP